MKRASNTSWPAELNSVKYGCCPQPTSRSPPGNTWAPPSKFALSPGECSNCLTSVTVLFVSLIDSSSARDCECTLGGPAPSSNIVSIPFGWSTTSCWKAVCVPGPILKLFWLEPSTHSTAPVWWSIL